MAEPRRKPRRVWLRVLVTAFVCVVVLGSAAAAVVVINRTEPVAEKSKSTRKSAALVDTLVVARGTHAPKLAVLGSVRPARDITLSTRVEGQVVEVGRSFVPGGRVSAGELLVRVDPADFENMIAERQSEYDQAIAALRIEEGRQVMARKELTLLEGSIQTGNRALVLREPQIESVKAQVKAAEASLARAKLMLDRTRIVAPFDAQVLTQAVNIGSQVSPGDELARLVGTAEYWVSASVPVRNLRWLRFADEIRDGSPVVVRNRDSWAAGSERRGTVTRLIGTLDQQTRLARVLISVPDPLAESTDAPPLILDSLVETEIEGRPIEDVVRLDRQYVRDGDTVWLMREGQLAIREVDVTFRDADYAYIAAGLDDGEEVVTSTLATVAEGVGLRRRGDPAPPRPAGDSKRTSAGAGPRASARMRGGTSAAGPGEAVWR